MFEYWRILSTDIILFSALQIFHITEACKTFRLIPYVTANPAMPVEYKATSVLCFWCLGFLLVLYITTLRKNNFWYLLGFMIPSGSVTSRTREKAKTKLDSWFSLKESHSIADTLWNHGLEWPSMRLRFAWAKRSFWLKARIVAAPDSDSAKWWRIGALWTPDKRASSLAVGM